MLLGDERILFTPRRCSLRGPKRLPRFSRGGESNAHRMAQSNDRELWRNAELLTDVPLNFLGRTRTVDVEHQLFAAE